MSETLPLWREGLLIPECRRGAVIPKRKGVFRPLRRATRAPRP